MVSCLVFILCCTQENYLSLKIIPLFYIIDPINLYIHITYGMVAVFFQRVNAMFTSSIRFHVGRTLVLTLI